MKKLSLLICVIITFYSQAQTIKIEIEKDTFKLNEKIEIKFSCENTNFRKGDFNFKNFIQNSISTQSEYFSGNDSTHNNLSVIFILTAIKSGSFTIKAPKFFIENKKVKYKPTKVYVLNEELTDEELEQIKNKKETSKNNWFIN